MNVTITTDVSVLHYAEISAYAYEIRCNDGVWRASALFNGYISDVNAAEAACIVNAIAFLCGLIKSKSISDVTYIVINTDNQKAIDGFSIALRRPMPKKSVLKKNQRLFVYTSIKKYVSKYNLPTINFRYVQAHIPEDKRAARNHINEWCDQESRRVARAAHKYVGRQIDRHLKDAHHEENRKLFTNNWFRAKR